MGVLGAGVEALVYGARPRRSRTLGTIDLALRQGLRELDTIEVMGAIIDGMWGKRLTYDELVD